MHLTSWSVFSILGPASVVMCTESPTITTAQIHVHKALTTAMVISMDVGAPMFSTEAVEDYEPNAAPPTTTLISHVEGSQETTTPGVFSDDATGEATDRQPTSDSHVSSESTDSTHASIDVTSSAKHSQDTSAVDHETNDSASVQLADTDPADSRVEAEEHESSHEGSHADQSSESHEGGESHKSEHGSEGGGEEAPAHGPIDDSNPVDRLKYAKHWRIDLPLWFIPVVFFLPLALTVLGMWLVYGGHHKRPHDFLSTLRNRGDMQRPCDITLAQHHGHERQAARQMKTEIRQREVEEAAFARGDPGAVYRYRANEEEHHQAQQRAHRSAYRMQVKQRRQLKKHLRVITEDGAIQGDADEPVSMDRYHSTMQASMRAQMRRRVVHPSPVDALAPVERIWMP